MPTVRSSLSSDRFSLFVDSFSRALSLCPHLEHLCVERDAPSLFPIVVDIWSLPPCSKEPFSSNLIHWQFPFIIHHERHF
jgi:hypothetical protein